MICDLAVRRSQQSGSELYTLRVSGRTALGSSGTGGRDSKDFATTQALLQALQTLGLPHDSLSLAEEVIADPALQDRFTDIARQVQVPFDVLERHDIYLFDQA